jgi:hypothetical protein
VSCLNKGKKFAGCLELTGEPHVLTGCAPPVRSGVYVSGHFNDLAAVAFLPPLHSPDEIAVTNSDDFKEIL